MIPVSAAKGIRSVFSSDEAAFGISSTERLNCSAKMPVKEIFCSCVAELYFSFMMEALAGLATTIIAIIKKTVAKT